MNNNYDIKPARQGFLVRYKDLEIGLDNATAKINLISHAHSDHISSNSLSLRTITSRETSKIYETKQGRKIKRVEFISAGDTIELTDNVKVTALNAGHVLGSLQFLIETDEFRLLYTGDFNAEDSILYEGARPVDTDILVVDSTYGAPHYVFPPRRELYSRIVMDALRIVSAGYVPVFKAYSLGKAQEAIALLERAKFDVICGNRIINQINQVYIESGIKLQNQGLSDISINEITATNRNIAFVISNMNAFSRSLRALFGESIAANLLGKTEVIPLTGWALKIKRGIPLSGHSDFSHLINFIENTNARKIYPFTSFGKVLAKILRQKGYDVEPL